MFVLGDRDVDLLGLGEQLALLRQRAVELARLDVERDLLVLAEHELAFVVARLGRPRLYRLRFVAGLVLVERSRRDEVILRALVLAEPIRREPGTRVRF